MTLHASFLVIGFRLVGSGLKFCIYILYVCMFIIHIALGFSCTKSKRSCGHVTGVAHHKWIRVKPLLNYSETFTKPKCSSSK